MKRAETQVKVRLPEDVAEWLKRSASQNLRTVSAEVAMVLRDRMAAEKSTAGRA